MKGRIVGYDADGPKVIIELFEKPDIIELGKEIEIEGVK